MEARATFALLTAIDDQAVAQIVGGNRDPHAISGQNADVVAPHAPGELRTYDGAALVHFDGVLTTTESVLNDALHFQKITFTHVANRLPRTRLRYKSERKLAQAGAGRKLVSGPPN